MIHPLRFALPCLTVLLACGSSAPLDGATEASGEVDPDLPPEGEPDDLPEAAFRIAGARWAQAAGDFDGDGLTDVVAGTDDAIHVVFGRTDGVTIDLESPDTADRFVIAGFEQPESGGFSFGAKSIGDVDGDGFGDLAVLTTQILGASRESILLGGPGTGTTTHDTLWAQGRAVAFAGYERGPSCGAGIHALGDINLDGYDDVAIETYYEQYAFSTCYAGAALLYLGDANGGQIRPDFGGSHLATIGDLDGDEIPEMARGVEYYDDFYEQLESMQLELLPGLGGGSTPIASIADGSLGVYSLANGADFTGDGVADAVATFGTIVESEGTWDVEREGLVAVVVSGAETGAKTLSDVRQGRGGFELRGVFPLEALPDLDGDGRSELLALGYDPSEPYDFFDAVYLIRGREAGLDLAAFVDGVDGTSLVTGEEDDDFGDTLAALGDATGDGVSDVVIAAPYADLFGVDRGVAWVVSGAAIADRLRP